MAEATVPDAEVTSAGSPRGSTGFANTGSYIRFVESTKIRLYVYALWLTGNKYTAEELLHETYCALWEKWSVVADQIIDDDGGYCLPYAKRVVKNRYLDSVASAVARRKREDTFSFSQPQPGEPENITLHDQVLRELRAAVMQLPTGHQDLIHEVYVEGHRIAKAARHLGLSESTARYQHKKALEALRQMIGAGDD